MTAGNGTGDPKMSTPEISIVKDEPRPTPLESALNVTFRTAVEVALAMAKGGRKAAMYRASSPSQRIRVETCGRIVSACDCCTYTPDADGVMADDWIVEVLEEAEAT